MTNRHNLCAAVLVTYVGYSKLSPMQLIGESLADRARSLDGINEALVSALGQVPTIDAGRARVCACSGTFAGNR